MNSLDSWIDLGEISELINQLLPEKPEERDNGVSLLGTPAAAGRITPADPDDDDPPLPLVPNVPPEWELAQPAGFTPSAYPSLDDLPGAGNNPPPEPAPAPAPVTEPVAEPTPPVVSEFAPQPPPLPPVPLVPEPEPVSEPAAAVEYPEPEPDEQPDLNPVHRAKIQATLAEIRDMGGDFLGPARVEIPPAPAPPESESEPEPVQDLVEAAPESEAEPEPAPETPKVDPIDPKEQALFLPQGPLGTRLKAYAKWVRGITDCQQLMVSDPQGYPLLPAENDADAPLISSSLQLMGALSHARKKMDANGPNSGVYLPLGPDRWLGVLDCESGSQRVCVSMITEAPLSAAAADELTAGLKRALEGVAA